MSSEAKLPEGPKHEYLEQIVAEISKTLSDKGRDLVMSAYRYANYLHADQKRASGEPYIVHPVAVAKILATYRVDGSTLTAAILHDCVEDCGVTTATISERFGSDVARLVDGLTKISKQRKALAASSKCGDNTDIKAKVKKAKDDDKCASLRKLLVTMARDLRIIIIKLADRCHNMETLSALRPDKQKRIADETLSFFGPIALRLGAWDLKARLEDMAFRYSDPDEYGALCEKVGQARAMRAVDVQQTMRSIRDVLKEAGIEATVLLRRKHLYSIHSKMKRTNRKLEEIFDLDAIGVEVDDVSQCYAAIGLIHQQWVPWQEKFRDYIASPKTNYYRALHTTIHGHKGQSVEVQICTRQHTRTNQLGVFGEFCFADAEELEARVSDESHPFEGFRPWINSLISLGEDSGSDQDYLDKVYRDVLSEQVFAFTPRGQAIDLPAGSTPIDFAYRVHSDIGNHCVGAYVNGVNVPLTGYHVKNNDTIEIQSSETASPSRSWFEHCKTSWAKSALVKCFKSEGPERNRELGKLFVQQRLAKEGLENLRDDDQFLEQVAGELGFLLIDDMYIDVGCCGTTSDDIDKAVRKVREGLAAIGTNCKSRKKARASIMLVRASDGSEVNCWFSGCCQPLSGDPIVGFQSKRGVKVHISTCSCLNRELLKQPDLRVDVAWGEASKRKAGFMKATFNIVSDLRHGLTGQIVAVFDGCEVDMLEYHFWNNVVAQTTRMKAVVIGESVEKADLLCEKIRNVAGVMSVERA